MRCTAEKHDLDLFVFAAALAALKDYLYLCCNFLYNALAPPSTEKSAAVIQLDSSEARKVAIQAMSSG